MNVEDRMHVYRGMVATLACAIYNGEDWNKQTVAGLLHLGDPSLDYVFSGHPPDELTEEDVYAALDRIFKRAGI